MRLTKPSIAEAAKIEYEKLQHYSFDNSREEYNEFKLHWQYIYNNKAKPYLFTLGEIKDQVSFFDRHYRMETIDKHVEFLIEDIKTGITMPQEMGPQAKNWSFHCCKMMWLIAQERTEGLYSTVQCKVTNNNILFHPGMSRIYSLMYLEAWDKPVVVWDVCGNVTDREPLTLEQHLNIFDIPDQYRFAAGNDDIMEIHIGERRDLINRAELDVKEVLFQHKKPTLIGKCVPYLDFLMIKNGPEDGVIIETKDDYELQETDLRHILGLYPGVNETYENENFLIRCSR